MPADLTAILHHLPAWLMVLFRLTGIFLLAPVLGSPALLRPVKVFLVVGLAFCVYPMLLEPGRQSAVFLNEFISNELTFWTLGGMVAVELLIGLAIGYCASLPLIAMQIAGQTIDQQVFPGPSGAFNPQMDEESTIVGEMFFIAALTIFVILGGHRVLLMTLVGSFEHVPLGAFTNFQALLELVLGMLSAAFELGIRIAAPLLCLIFLEMVAMGFITRTVPGINILSVGFAIRSIVGAATLMIAIGIMIGVYTEALQVMLRRLMGFFALE